MRFQPPTRHSGTRGGFTLLEVLIAFTILAIGLLAMAAMQLHAMKFARSGKHSSAAAVIARDQMELLQWVDWNDPGFPATGTWTLPTPMTKDVQSPGGPVTEQNYALRWRITDVIPNRTRSLDVQVTWNEPDRPNRVYAVSSIRVNTQ